MRSIRPQRDRDELCNIISEESTLIIFFLSALTFMFMDTDGSFPVFMLVILVIVGWFNHTRHNEKLI